MQNTLLISEAKVKAFTDINNNLDPSLIKSTIREAQIIHITRLLGTKLYDKIIDDVDAGTLTGNYKSLVDDYVQDALLYWSYYESLESIYLRPRNNGLSKFTFHANITTMCFNYSFHYTQTKPSSAFFSGSSFIHHIKAFKNSI